MVFLVLDYQRFTKLSENISPGKEDKGKLFLVILLLKQTSVAMVNIHFHNDVLVFKKTTVIFNFYID